MSTDYDVTLIASDGTTTKVQIIDSINPLPLSDRWTGDAAMLGSAGGVVASWGTGNAVLHTGPGGAGNVTLEGFNKSTKTSDTGSGSKINDLGEFPDGDLTWTCNKVD